MTIIYGGSFNPPTIAHFQIAKHIINKFSNSEFYFLPTNNFYNKDNLKDFNYRCDMLEIMCKHLDNKAKVSYFEINLDKYYGTYYTLQHFQDPYFVMGSDNLLTITNWINYPYIVIENKFIIIPRNNVNIKEVISNNEVLNKYKDNFIILDEFSEIDLSSSEYRKTQNKNLLLTEVAKYIEKNNLYKE